MTALVCAHCGREYQRPHALERHVLTCRLLEAAEGRALRPVPPPETLYAMLIELATQHQRLLGRFETMQRSLPTKKRRLGLLEWLERTHADGASYEEWQDKLQIGRADLELVFRMGHKKGLAEILTRLLPAGASTNNPPVRSFTQQPTTLFLRSANAGWRVAGTTDIEALVGRMAKGLTAELVAWHREHANKAHTDDFAALLTQRVRRATGADHPIVEMVSHVRGHLCRHLRARAYTLVECEVSE
jgi:hypothetical protein